MPAKFLFIFSFIICTTLHAQTDSLQQTGSTGENYISQSGIANTTNKDSAQQAQEKVILNWQQDTAFNRFFINKNVPRNKQSVFAINSIRQPVHQDEQFYILAGVLLFTGLIRAMFPKYFTVLFQLFFQSSQRQRHSKESAAQDALPSFLMNILFILSGGLLLAALIKGDNSFPDIAFPLLWLYSCAALAVIYITKALFITFFGWAFGVEEIAGSYNSVVFLINKVAGLLFIPCLLILIYSTGGNLVVISTVTIALIFILLIYRYIISLSVIGKKLKINPLHFFIYLCAVEILPLLITYKVLLITKEL